MKYTRKATPVVLATTLALTLAACAQSERTSGTDQTTGGDTKATFTFGAAGAPEVFDPFYASDGETFRVTRQMFEGLVGIKAGTADIEPELAEKWEPSQDGKSWTFSLRKGVKFTDGEAFNAAAVCYNFDRMFDQNEVAAAGPAEYWSGTMGGFKSDAANSLYKSCEAKDDSTAVINITHPTSKFPTALSLDSFSMQSPKALKAGDANNVTKQGEGFGYPAYSKSPVGTGPYKLEKYDEANKTITLVRNDDYWGEKAKTAKITFKIIPDESTRRQELKAGSIDGYDLPNPVDWKGLKDDGNNLLVRPAFNILYLGLNPEKAKSLLKEAGAEGMTLTFAYPSEVSRPYMPNPQKIHDALRSDLEKVGIKVNVVTKPWNGGYLDSVDKGQFDAWLLGWTGDYNAPDNFIGTFFGSLASNDFHTKATSYGKTLSEDLVKDDAIVDEAARTAAYEKLNQQIMEEYLPGLPLTHSPPALVVGPDVQGVVASPLTAETFSTVTVGGK